MDNYTTESLLDVSSYHYSNSCLMDYVSLSNQDNNVDMNNTLCGSLLRESVDSDINLDFMYPLQEMKMSDLAAMFLDEETGYRDNTPLVSTTPLPSPEEMGPSIYACDTHHNDYIMDISPPMDFNSLTPNVDTTLQDITPTIQANMNDTLYQHMVDDINRDDTRGIPNMEPHQRNTIYCSQSTADNSLQDITPTLYSTVNDSILRDMVNDLNTDSQRPSPSFKSPLPMKPSRKPRTCVSKDKTAFKCTYCGKRFTNRANFTNHIRVHSGERPYSCNICQKTFAQSATLKTHARTHTGEKPFSCEFCRRGFSDYSTYSKHVRTHTGDKPYKCDTCPAAFAQSGNLNRHQKIHLKGNTRKSKFMR
ncbi:unnamed protein product [Owenia fusiformis]|uniref:C2H2-type domain-containing protein n=1 Tax=Owenia fusiformis TaxID=6347 RepID=A0A8S4N2J9_OWEFU|nr:unnamed protein product [Owenia fusiformis]